MTTHSKSDETSRPETATSNDFGVHRRDLLALGAAAAIGTGLGTGVSAVAAQDDGGEETGLFLAAATGDQQTDPIDTSATGGAVFSVSEDGSELEYALLVNAIEDVTQAHIHLGGPGEDGPIAVWLYPGPDASEPELQEGRFDGILATGTITDEHVTEEVEGQTVDALLEEIANENAYVNVHTEEHPGGEIRGQVVSVADVVAAMTDDAEPGDDDGEPEDDVDEPQDDPEDDVTDDDDGEDNVTDGDGEDNVTNGDGEDNVTDDDGEENVTDGDDDGEDNVTNGDGEDNVTDGDGNGGTGDGNDTDDDG